MSGRMDDHVVFLGDWLMDAQGRRTSVMQLPALVLLSLVRSAFYPASLHINTRFFVASSFLSTRHTLFVVLTKVVSNVLPSLWIRLCLRLAAR